MKISENVLSLTFGILGILAWFFPSIDLKYKLIITVIGVLSIVLILFKEKLSYFFRKNWQLIISLALGFTFYVIFKRAYSDLLLPASLVLLASVSITLLLIFKYHQPVTYKTKELIKKFAIDGKWNVNHWGSSFASIANNKMVFTGFSEVHGPDGSHIDFLDGLEIGSTYEVSCFAKSAQNTTAKFQLWCHDKIGEINGVSIITPYKTPSNRGEIISLIFTAEFNPHIRIHLQYSPGKGEIEVSNVKICKIEI